MLGPKSLIRATATAGGGGNWLCQAFLNRGRARYGSGASANHENSHKEQFNEPGGYLFGRIPGKEYPVDWSIRIYSIFYLGGLGVFAFLYQYKPDTEWARREAERRMKERGVDIEQYRYKLPEVY